MPRQALESLTETMFYVLMALYRGEKCGIDSKTVRRLRANENIETKTIEKLCAALDCDISDIMEYRKE